MKSVTREDLTAALECLDVPLVGTNSRGLLQVFNEAYVKWIRHSREWLDNRYFAELIPPEDRQRLKDRVSNEPQGVRYHLVVLRGDGERTPTEIHVTPIQVDGEPWLVSAIIDLPDQSRRLALGEKLFEISAALASEQTEAALLAAVVRLFENAGYRAGVYELRGDELVQLERGSYRVKPSVEYAKQAFAQGRVVFGDVARTIDATPTRAYLPVGPTETRHRFIVIEGANLATDYAPTLGLFAKGFSSMLQSAQAREEMVKRQQLAAVGELSAVLAHELRNPLGVVFNAVSSLRRHVQDGDGLDLLGMVHQECDRLNRLVGELLDFARPREPIRTLEPLEPVILEAIDAALTTTEPADPNVDVLYRGEKDLPPVAMDREQFRQALVNTVVNAVQALPGQGTVRITSRREGNLARIDISDDGNGIPEEALSRIFEPFFTTKAKGTGLGLAIVRRILESHQGTVEVSSTGTQGTTFTFRVPFE